MRERVLQRFLDYWEIYPILVIATIFRVYGANNSNYQDDQAGMWRFVRDTFTHHVLAASSNRSSVGILHGYFTTYFLMPVAAFTANPMWGAVEVGLFNVLGVLITYLLMRRYYGRFIASIAAALYAVSTTIVLYNRFIWQPNLAPPLIIALMYFLYRGAVERKRGWFFPAVVLMGLVYETHESSMYMVIPIAVAMIFATFKTIRWRDILFAAIALLIIFFPSMLWLVSSHFHDIPLLIGASKLPATVDGHVFQYYSFFISPYLQSPSNWIDTLPSDPHSALAMTNAFMIFIRHFLEIVRFTAPCLAFCGGVTIFLLLFKSNPTVVATEQATTVASRIKNLASGIYNDPTKRGYVLLLVWQGILPLFLIRYTVPLAGHYLTFLMPGPCILIALFIGKLLDLTREYRPNWQLALGPIIYAVISLTICAEMIGTSALVIDTANGVFDSHNYFPIYYNDYGSIENAVSAADQLARQRHIHHIYIAANLGVMEGIKYFSQNIHTPVTIFDNAHCLALPGPQVGPVVYMDAPYSPLAETLLHQYANATLISQLKRLGGDPFNLYVLSPKSTPRTTVSPQQDFTSTLQLQEPQAHYISTANESWMVTHWQLAQSASSDWRTTYDYAFRANLTGQAVDANEPADECVMTRVQAGDQLFVGFDLPSLQGQVPTTVSLEVQYLVFKPWLLHFGPIRFQTFDDRIDQDLHLHMLNRQEALTLPGA